MEIKDRKLTVGQSIVFVDSRRNRIPALVQAVHGELREYQDGWYVPCINLIHVSINSDKTDQYGRQVEHATSISHHSSQRPCIGFCWYWPDEEVVISESDIQTQR